MRIDSADVTGVKVILSLMVFFCFAAMFGVALISTKWNARQRYTGDEDDSR